MKSSSVIVAALLVTAFTIFGLLELAVSARRPRMTTLFDGSEPGQLEQIGNANWRAWARASCRADQGNGFLGVEELVRRFPDQVRVLGRLQRQQRHLPALTPIRRKSPRQTATR